MIKEHKLVKLLRSNIFILKTPSSHKNLEGVTINSLMEFLNI